VSKNIYIQSCRRTLKLSITPLQINTDVDCDFNILYDFCRQVKLMNSWSVSLRAIPSTITHFNVIYKGVSWVLMKHIFSWLT